MQPSRAAKTSLAERLLAAKAAAGLASTPALAKAIGIHPGTLVGVLSGLGVPSAATRTKYQAFLGLDDAAFAELMETTLRAMPHRRAHRAAAAKPRSGTVGPARDGMSGNHPLAGALAMLTDPLVTKVHAAPAPVRAAIARILERPAASQVEEAHRAREQATSGIA